MAKRLLTDEQLDLFKKNNSGKSLIEMTEWVNKNLGLNLTKRQVNALRGNNHLDSGLTGRFKEGDVAWNKGKHTATEIFLSHRFTKENAPNPKLLPLYTERRWKEGFIKIKVAEPNVWKLKHHYVWEQAYGPIPKNKVILFLDGDKGNCELSNLRLVEKRIQSTVAIRHLCSKNKELNKAGILVTELEFKIADKKKETDESISNKG